MLHAPLKSLSTQQSGEPMQPADVALNGSALNIDYPSYLSQHDVVYHIPPPKGGLGMPLGDGDLGAMLWCPGHLQMQIQKSDLWDDPPLTAQDGAIPNPSAWCQLSAGAVSLRSEHDLFSDLRRFEQRLSLY